MKYDPEERLTFTQIEYKMKDLSARAPAPSPSTSPSSSPSLRYETSDDESDDETSDEDSDHQFESAWKLCKRRINDVFK